MNQASGSTLAPDRSSAVGMMRRAVSEAMLLARERRACRDARQVAGDAMVVRGGCGYIEDFNDERLHLARLVLTHRLLPIDPLDPRQSKTDLAAEAALLER